MELSNYLVSWVVTYLGDLQPTYIGVIIYLLSTMDILVVQSLTEFKTFQKKKIVIFDFPRGKCKFVSDRFYFFW